MIVMDDIREDYTTLYDLNQETSPSQEYINGLSEKIRVFLLDLHQNHMVHGDMRNINIMVKRSGLDDFRLVDFDWCGFIEKARYPPDVNTATVRRPDGVVGGNLIEAGHDLEMLKYIWE